MNDLEEIKTLLRTKVAIDVIRAATDIQAMYQSVNANSPMVKIDDLTYEVDTTEMPTREEAIATAAETIKREMPLVMKHLGVSD